VSGVIVTPDGDRRDLVAAVQSGAMPAIAGAIRVHVLASLQSHPMRQVTQAEIKRRADICLRWYENLRGDLGWPVDRVLSAIGSALVAELDGRTYEPDTQAVMWKPNEALEPFAAVLRDKPVMRDALAARLN
jgi:hypothetical protein